ncbi:hypothetical protein D3C75_772920 [compost metagenome]
MCLRTQRVDHACDFNRDITCTNNRDAFWQRRKREEAIGINTVLSTWNRRTAWTATGGNQDVVCGDGFAVHFNRVRIDKFRKAANHIDVVFTQHVVIRGVDAVDIRGAAGDQFVPVEFIHRGVETVIRAVVVDSFGDLRRVPHYFFRYATHVYAGTAQLFRLNQCAFLSIHRRTVNGGNTAAAAANGEVVIMFGHDVSLMSRKIFAIVARRENGSTDSCNSRYSGTTQLNVVEPLPDGTRVLCSHGSTLAICCSSFHGGLITIMPEAVMPRRSLSGSTASSI